MYTFARYNYRLLHAIKIGTRAIKPKRSSRFRVLTFWWFTTVGSPGTRSTTHNIVICSCIKWVKVIVLSSCVRAEDILCKCAIHIRLSALHVIINSTNNNLRTYPRPHVNYIAGQNIAALPARLVIIQRSNSKTPNAEDKWTPCVEKQQPHHRNDHKQTNFSASGIQ